MTRPTFDAVADEHRRADRTLRVRRRRRVDQPDRRDVPVTRTTGSSRARCSPSSPAARPMARNVPGGRAVASHSTIRCCAAWWRKERKAVLKHEHIREHRLLGDVPYLDLVCAEAQRALATGDKDRLPRILLASWAIPGHAEIDGSLYVDGAITGNILGGRIPSEDRLCRGWSRKRVRAFRCPRSANWVIFKQPAAPAARGRAAQLEDDPAAQHDDRDARMATVNSIRHLSRWPISRLKGADVEVPLIAVPNDSTPPKPGVFEKDVMNALADMGERMGADPRAGAKHCPDVAAAAAHKSKAEVRHSGGLSVLGPQCSGRSACRAWLEGDSQLGHRGISLKSESFSTPHAPAFCREFHRNMGRHPGRPAAGEGHLLTSYAAATVFLAVRVGQQLLLLPAYCLGAQLYEQWILLSSAAALACSPTLGRARISRTSCSCSRRQRPAGLPACAGAASASPSCCNSAQ